MILQIENLCLEVQTPEGPRRVVDDVSLALSPGRTLALVGESGSGKSLTALSILRLLPAAVRKTAGRVLFDKRAISAMTSSELCRLRGGSIAMIFQEPLSSLNPVISVGSQVSESLQLHRGLRGSLARRRVIELFKRVGIAAPERRVDAFPHELSGGMRQRVMIAMALAGEPKVLLADEPTTALDATIQAQIVELLRDLQAETGLAVLFITHDLGLVAAIADDVCVMRAGRIVEQGTTEAVLQSPQHAYTQKLLAAVPRLHAK